MFRLIELALLLICLSAAAIIGYRYYKAAAERRAELKDKNLGQDVEEFLKKKRKKE